MKKVPNFTRFLVDNGLLFEINKQILHPLGLALTVDVHPDNSKWIVIDGLSSVDDEDDEGFLFDDDSFEVGKRNYELFLLKSGQKKLDKRLDKLGFLIQNNEDSEK